MVQRFDEFPFIDERLVCGINAFIELLNLPVGKLLFAERTAIGEKLFELSNSDGVYSTLTSQSVKFNSIIEQRFSEEEEHIERLYQLTEEKYRHFMRTREYI